MTLLDDMLALLADNTSGDISAADMRSIVTSLYNNFLPLSGGTLSGSVSLGDQILYMQDGSLKAHGDGGDIQLDGDNGVYLSVAGTEVLGVSAGALAITGTAAVGGQAVVVTNDSRLSNSRTPTAHASSHTDGGADELTITIDQIPGMVSTLNLKADLEFGQVAQAQVPNIAQSKVTSLVTDLGLKAPLASPTFTGAATAVALTMSGRQLNTPVALTPGTTVSVDASLGNDFTLTAGQSFTLANPTNPVNGQKILFTIRQDGAGSRVMTLDTNYRFGTDITAAVLSTAINKTDYLGVRYNGTDSKWDVLFFLKGY